MSDKAVISHFKASCIDIFQFILTKDIVCSLVFLNMTLNLMDPDTTVMSLNSR